MTSEYDLKSVVESLYKDIKPKYIYYTSRQPQDYKRLLSLTETPLEAQSSVLDIASGNASITAGDFGLAEENFTRVDIDPKQPNVQQANMLNLPFEDSSFNEVWAIYALQYVESNGNIPSEILTRLYTAAFETPSVTGTESTINNFLTLLGLQCIGEMVRVTKPNGRIRVAANENNFSESRAMQLLIQQTRQGNLEGIDIADIQVGELDPATGQKEAHVFIQIGPEFQYDQYFSFLEEQFTQLVPENFINSIINYDN